MGIRTGLTIAAVLGSSALSGADPRWIRLPSQDFEIYSSASEGNAREVLQQFEQVRGFFEQTMHGSAGKSDPVRIIVFGSPKEFEPYRLNEFAVAYYAPRGGRDYIVLGSTAKEEFPIVVHEYVHLVAQHAGMHLPPWLNEGMAELYSTLRPSGNQIIVGDLIIPRMRALVTEKWVPLATIVSADSNSPYYNEKNKAGSLYNEGWAFTHMLVLDQAYGKGFSGLIDAIQAGTPSQQAIENVYGKPLAAIEKDLQGYIRGDRFRAAIVPAKLQSASGRTAAEPASMFDVKLALADLIDRPGKEDETRKQLLALIAEDPKRPEPDVALGYLAWRAGQPKDAETSFGKAVELGSRNPKMLWDYGRMAANGDRPASIQALKMLLEEQPARIDVRLVLAQVQLNEKQPADALLTLVPVKSVLPADAPTLFRICAYAEMQLGDHAAALSAAQRWEENAKDPADREIAVAFLKYLDSVAPGPARQAPPQAASQAGSPIGSGVPVQDETPRPPQLQRRGPDAAPVERISPRLQLPVAEGAFTLFDCGTTQPRLVIQNAQGKQSFQIDDPNKVLIDGGGKTIELTCGPQKPVAVRIEYLEPQNAIPGVRGILRAIHFGVPAPDPK